jgi:hypothetical protein
MVKNNNNSRKPWMRSEPVEKSRSCGCGGEAKLKSRMNYPFGRKSKGIKITEYVCKKCSKRDLVSNRNLSDSISGKNRKGGR